MLVVMLVDKWAGQLVVMLAERLALMLVGWWADLLVDH